MQINKNKLLTAFKSVSPGLAKREIIEQSASFGFKDNHIVTYNDEISIRCPIDIDLEGAVEASSFYNILNKMKPDKEGNIDIEIQENSIILKGARKGVAGLTLQTELKLPLDEIEIGDWKHLPKNFKEGLNTCLFTVSKNMSTPILTCISIQGDKVQSSDDIRMTQYNLPKKSKIKCLIPGTSVQQLLKYDFKKYALTDEWIHFLTVDEAVFSCRILNESFPDISKIIDVQGEEIKFPRSTVEALEKAGVFSKRDISADEVIKISISDSKMVVKGEGASGWYKQTMPIRFKGSLSFEVNPNFLRDILVDLKECIIDPESGLMKFINPNWEHVLSFETGETEE